MIDHNSYTLKYNELDKAFLKYHEKHRRQIQKLELQCKEEISRNAELQKYVSVLEARIKMKDDTIVHLERCMEVNPSPSMNFGLGDTTHLQLLSSDTEHRVQSVEKREKECIEKMALLRVMEQHCSIAVAALDSKYELYTESIVMSNKSAAEQHFRYLEAADATLLHLETTQRMTNEASQELAELKMSSELTRSRMSLGQEESLFRDNIMSDERRDRYSIFNSFYSRAMWSLQRALQVHSERESELSHSKELAALKEVELATWLRHRWSVVETEREDLAMRRKEFILSCQNVLWNMRSLVSAHPIETGGPSILQLQKKIHDLLLCLEEDGDS